MPEYPQAREQFHVLCKPIGPRCNLRCEHCFYLAKDQLYPADERFRMTAETVEEFTRQYIACMPDGAQEVNFSWQGGEPTLMGLDFFRRAVDLQKKYLPPGRRILNSLQTNGTLLDDDWAKFLHDEQFLVGLSIDGPAELHDRYRKDAKGDGSLAPALRGLAAMQRHQVEFNTLTCIQDDNGQHPLTVYRFLRDTVGSTFMQFIPIVEVLPEGGVTHRTVRPRQFGAFLSAIFDEWREHDVGRIFVQHFDMMLGVVMGYPPSLCVHSPRCGRNVALEHNGDVFQCDHFVYPEHQLGNIHETSLAAAVDSDQATRFGAAKTDALPDYCLKCRYRRFCNGGCPAHRLDRTATGEEGLNYLCEGYRMFYEHSMPYLQAMAECLRHRLPCSEWRQFMDGRQQPPGPAAARGPVGRNDPCPCGSGKKYKKCCGAKRR